jgi:hypothetical protein
MPTLNRDYFFGKKEVKVALWNIYNGICQIGNCKRKTLSKEDRAKTKIITFEHIYPKMGNNLKDSLDNGTLSCEYCNTDKGKNVLLDSNKKKERTLHNKLVDTAREKKINVIRFLMNKRFEDQVETVRSYRIQILSYIYNIERHKDGFITILDEYPKKQLQESAKLQTEKIKKTDV